MIIMDVQHVVEVDTLRGKDIFIHVFTAIRRNMIKNLSIVLVNKTRDTDVLTIRLYLLF